MTNYHVLNGDALAERFPSEKIPGEIIIARECLVDGPVHSKSLSDLFEIRSEFIQKSYDRDGSYQAHVVSEFDKIIHVDNGQVFLWFEEDLFCQINLWFICSLLYMKGVEVFLVMPKGQLRYGFAGLDNNALITAYEDRKALTKINVNQFALLWFAYRKDNIERLLKLGVQLHSDFPFVMEAIAAHFDRLPKDGKPGKPEQLIQQIIEEKSTKEFGIVFQEFTKRAPIYGFGDLQVKRIFDEIVKDF